MQVALEKYHPYIRKIWVLENKTQKLKKNTGIMIGDGRFEMVFVTGKGYRTIRPTGSDFFSEGIYLGGQMDRPLELEIEQDTSLLSIKLEPWAAASLSGFDFKQALNRTVPLGEINPELNRQLQYLLPSSQLDKILERLSIALADPISSPKDIQLVKSCCQILDSGYADFKTARDLYLKNNKLSTRSIEQKFSRTIGLSPQKYSNGIRLRKVSEELKFGDPSTSYISLAYKYGFFDQPHFVNLFKAYWGFSPKKIINSDTFITNPEESLRYYTM
ncbi:helix-turn-helix domain-containing protein [Poritiphilus flavus]|uniref:Helix-turn-helix domain-containing protein n=1 Tax=Poritiphilus flavus TaxID=2697053 RepID=A0A6L9EHM1_9FLAO|nr:helix-turn-helix domain-containing protein [Poritiphilus flavus]NAS14152.1 helix-turn-helix domain-containing protein [Poritiphilus flavus]